MENKWNLNLIFCYLLFSSSVYLSVYCCLLFFNVTWCDMWWDLHQLRSGSGSDKPCFYWSTKNHPSMILLALWQKRLLFIWRGWWYEDHIIVVVDNVETALLLLPVTMFILFVAVAINVLLFHLLLFCCCFVLLRMLLMIMIKQIHRFCWDRMGFLQVLLKTTFYENSSLTLLSVRTKQKSRV